jgi:hypothetical protein
MVPLRDCKSDLQTALRRRNKLRDHSIKAVCWQTFIAGKQSYYLTVRRARQDHWQADLATKPPEKCPFSIHSLKTSASIGLGRERN